MDFKKLNYFLMVAKEGQITRAAKELHIAQPPLSHQLKSLEKELGVQLIQKVGRNIQLTETGRLLSDRGEQLVSLVQKITKELQDVHQGATGVLHIGCSTAWGTAILPEKIVQFHTQYPQIKYHIYEKNSHTLTELLNSGILELAIVFPPIDTTLYETLALPSEPVVVAIPKKLDPTPKKCTIRLQEVIDIPFIIHKNSREILAFAEKNNLAPNIICFHEDSRSMLSLANAGLGLTIVPKSTADLMPNHNLVYKDLIEPVYEIGVKIIWVKKRYLSRTAHNFLTMINKGKAIHPPELS